jgi:hypothetical protein
LGAYESGVIDTIRRMIADGSLPWGETCMVSGSPTDEVLDVVVHCERVHAARESSKLMVLFALLSPILALLALREERREPLGRETSVSVPLRVSSPFHRKLARRGSRGELRRLLRSVPVYAELLDRYPDATVEIREERGKEKEGPGFREL